MVDRDSMVYIHLGKSEKNPGLSVNMISIHNSV